MYVMGYHRICGAITMKYRLSYCGSDTHVIVNNQSAYVIIQMCCVFVCVCHVVSAVSCGIVAERH